MREWSLPFPRLSDDPLEQFLIAEAVMTRYADDLAAAERQELERVNARRQAEEQLAEFRARQ